MVKHLPDITGRRFGFLIAEEQSVFLKKGNARSLAWRCVCDCGTVKDICRPDLLSGRVASCGCQVSKPIHGLSKRPGYGSYIAMIRRCHNEHDKDFARYGARGVSVCPRWIGGEDGKSGVECFFADMGERPAAGLSIERSDNSKGYSPSNCVWASSEDQARNTRRNYFDPGVDPKLICRNAGVRYGTFRARIAKGWSIESSLDPRDTRGRR